MDPFTWTYNVGRPTRTYVQQLYMDSGCSLEDMLEAMENWDKLREREREWEREKERETGKFVHAEWHDDVDDDDLYLDATHFVKTFYFF